MAKTHMTKGGRVVVVEDHSIPAREAQGWVKVTAAKAAGIEESPATGKEGK